MNNKFIKTNLKTGDVVLFRNHEVGIVIIELGILIMKNWWFDLNNLHDNLTSKYCENCDIIAVRRPCDKSQCQFKAFNYGWGELIYGRKQ